MDSRINHLHSVRSFELDSVIALLENYNSEKDEIRILEIGAGTGWQAEKLSQIGYFVYAIDLPSSNYREQRVFKVIDYDGKNIKFEDNFFDIVYSSNVLEHIPHLKSFQSELKRVLKKDGLCIHLMPSGSWRFWTNITYYLRVLKKLFFPDKRNSLFVTTGTDDYKSRGKRTLLSKAFPSLHGEKGNFITEIYYFSRFYWSSFFSSNEWHLLKVNGNKLFYTGNSIFGSFLSIKGRNILHYILGSSCNIFVLKNKL
mgnify:FL=1